MAGVAVVAFRFAVAGAEADAVLEPASLGRGAVAAAMTGAAFRFAVAGACNVILLLLYFSSL